MAMECVTHCCIHSQFSFLVCSIYVEIYLISAAWFTVFECVKNDQQVWHVGKSFAVRKNINKYIYTMSQKNCASLFLSELRQISINFNKFRYVDGKMAEIVCYIYISHLTWPTSLHYLVKRGCSKFLPDTGIISVRLLRFGDSEGDTVAATFLLRSHCQICTGCPRTIFCVSIGRHPSALFSSLELNTN